jgi:serine protease Do
MKLHLVWLLISATLNIAVATHSEAKDPVSVSFSIWSEASQSDTESELDRLNRAFGQLANKARPAVVQIRVTLQKDPKAGTDAPANGGSRGSGFVIHPDGYILTAHHVIDKAKDIEVRLPDAQRLPARIIGVDSQADLAILKIEAERQLPLLSLADSDSIRVGDLAVVLGYPFGRESSMHLGIISRSGRTFPDSASYEFIQTDAGAYAGCSGGPLLNSKGHVVGMVTMAAERGNMGFAVPINVVKRLIPRLIAGEKLVWGWLGVRMAEVSLDEAKSLGLSPLKGVLVSAVLPGQAAERGGILSRDVIVAVNGTHVESPRDVNRMISGLEAGYEVKLTIMRKGQTLQLSVPLGTKPRPSEAREG